MDETQHKAIIYRLRQIDITLVFATIILLIGLVCIFLSLMDITSTIRAIPTLNATPITVNVAPAQPAINIYPGPTETH